MSKNTIKLDGPMIQKILEVWNRFYLKTGDSQSAALLTQIYFNKKDIGQILYG